MACEFSTAQMLHDGKDLSPGGYYDYNDELFYLKRKRCLAEFILASLKSMSSTGKILVVETSEYYAYRMTWVIGETAEKISLDITNRLVVASVDSVPYDTKVDFLIFNYDIMRNGHEEFETINRLLSKHDDLTTTFLYQVSAPKERVILFQSGTVYDPTESKWSKYYSAVDHLDVFFNA